MAQLERIRSLEQYEKEFIYLDSRTDFYDKYFIFASIVSFSLFFVLLSFFDIIPGGIIIKIISILFGLGAFLLYFFIAKRINTQAKACAESIKNVYSIKGELEYKWDKTKEPRSRYFIGNTIILLPSIWPFKNPEANSHISALIYKMPEKARKFHYITNTEKIYKILEIENYPSLNKSIVNTLSRRMFNKPVIILILIFTIFIGLAFIPVSAISADSFSFPALFTLIHKIMFFAGLSVIILSMAYNLVMGKINKYAP